MEKGRFGSGKKAVACGVGAILIGAGIFGAKKAGYGEEAQNTVYLDVSCPNGSMPQIDRVYDPPVAGANIDSVSFECVSKKQDSKPDSKPDSKIEPVPNVTMVNTPQEANASVVYRFHRGLNFLMFHDGEPEVSTRLASVNLNGLSTFVYAGSSDQAPQAPNQG